MTSEERLARSKLAIETKLKREDQALARKQADLAEAQFEWQKEQGSHSGWKAIFTPTGVVLVGAAVGLMGTAVGKWADYLSTKKQQETTIILKASDVPQALSPQAQDIQRARNLLWFAEARYIDLPDQFVAQLKTASKLAPGQVLPPPVLQPLGPSTAAEIVSKFEEFTPTIESTGSSFVIGFGHFLTDEEMKAGAIKLENGESIDTTNRITEQQGQRILQSDLAPSYRAVDSLVKVPISPEQRDALASFVFNVGPRSFSNSNILKKLNEGRYEEVPAEIEKWTLRTGKTSKFLQDRRKMEANLWNRPPSGAAKTQSISEKEQGASQRSSSDER